MTRRLVTGRLVRIVAETDEGFLEIEEEFDVVGHIVMHYPGGSQSYPTNGVEKRTRIVRDPIDIAAILERVTEH